MATSGGPLKRYQHDLRSGNILEDEAQERAVRQLQRVYAALLQRREDPGRRFLLFGRPKKESVKGLYLWGGVGRGKTYLMDIFHDSLPFEQKLRVHFHRFMQRVHAELTALQGVKNPLQVIAKKLADENEVICFDEFFVTDITDAMLLAGLFSELFSRGVALVATSNIVPDRLYENGLQRERFVPAIHLIKEHCEILHVDSDTDYRLRALTRAEIYHCPLDTAADISLMNSFRALIPESCTVESDVALEINRRTLRARLLADDIVWFEFAELCDGPRSQMDYIELAREFHAVVLSNVPRMRASDDDRARRFINLVDEFYDRSVKLIVSAEEPIDSLYADGRLEFEFARTRSRLQEMQSVEYLGRPHKP